MDEPAKIVLTSEKCASVDFSEVATEITQVLLEVDTMAENQIRNGIREALEPLDGIHQDLAIKRWQWLSTLVPKRSELEICLNGGGVVVGIYMSHDDKGIVISNSTYTKTVDFMEIEGIDQLA